METATRKIALAAALVCGSLLASHPAHALRCDGKLVLEGMLELEVREYCGEPTAVRQKGFVVRSFNFFELQKLSDVHAVRFGPGNFYQHLLVTEYIYNFGPSRLMRKLRFEGGILTEVETLGYGFHDHSE